MERRTLRLWWIGIGSCDEYVRDDAVGAAVVRLDDVAGVFQRVDPAAEVEDWRAGVDHVGAGPLEAVGSSVASAA